MYFFKILDSIVLKIIFYLFLTNEFKLKTKNNLILNLKKASIKYKNQIRKEGENRYNFTKTNKT